MALEVNKVPSHLARSRVLIRAAEEMVIADLDQGRERCIGCQVAADIRIVFIRPHHHRQRIPADQTFNAPFERTIPRIGHLFFRRNGVDVRCIPTQWNSHAQVGSAFHQVFEQVTGPVRAYLIDDIVESLNPFGGFLRVKVVGCFYSWFQHEGSY